jgi:hypothetical protein
MIELKNAVSHGGSEYIQNTIHRYFHLAQRSKDLQAMHGHSIAENYGAGRISLICNLNISMALAPVFLSEGINNEPVGDGEFSAALVYSANVPNKSYLNFGNKQPVFVDIVKLTQMPEQIAISSRVWLYDILNECGDTRGSLLFQSAIYGIDKFIPGSTYREFRKSIGFSDEPEHGIVKGTSEIVKCVPDHKEKFLWNGFNRLQLEQIASCLNIAIDPYGIRVNVIETLKSSVKVIDVLFGPFNL